MLPGDAAAAQAARRVEQLQRVLERLLAGRGPRLLKLNLRDPMRLFADYSYLDSAIAHQWAEPATIILPGCAA